MIGWFLFSAHNFKIERRNNPISLPLRSTQEIMALSRFTPIFGRGFDDFFAPSPFFSRDPVFDLMPVVNSLTRDEDFKLFRSSPGYEITESEGKYQIAVDVPGVKASDMTIQLENEGRVLHISGGRKITKENAVSETKFEKRFTIGNNVDTTKLSANLADGVLVISAPKLEKKVKPDTTIKITEGPHEKYRSSLE